MTGSSQNEPEPAEVLKHRGDEIEAEADGIEVVVAEKERAAGDAGTFGGEPERPGVTEVEVPRRRGGEATRDRLGDS